MREGREDADEREFAQFEAESGKPRPKPTRRKSGEFLLIDDMDWYWTAYKAARGKAEFAVMQMIYRACRKSGSTRANVSYQRVAGGHGISWNTWCRAVKSLEAAGLIDIERHQGAAHRAEIRQLSCPRTGPLRGGGGVP